MTREERRAQLVAVEGRIVRDWVSARKYLAVMECQTADALNRTKRRLEGQGWTIKKTSGFSVQVEVKL